MDLQPVNETAPAQPPVQHAAVLAELAATLEACDADAGRHGAGSEPPRRQRPPKLYRIGEIVRYAGVSRQTIHNYTVMGLLHETQWTGGGHRLYDESVFERLDVIDELRRQRKGLPSIIEHMAQFDAQRSPQQEPISS